MSTQNWVFTLVIAAIYSAIAGYRLGVLVSMCR